MMRKIYGSAKSVMIWLGNATYQIDLTMCRISSGLPLWASGTVPGEKWTPAQAQGALQLCERSYWRRMWIIQETVLAKEAYVHCGSETVEWSKFVQMFEDVPHQGLQETLRASSGIHKAGERQTPCLTEVLGSPAQAIVQMKSLLESNPRPLRDLIRWCARQEATKPQDKVYALLGIAIDGDDIVVDYDKSLEDLQLELDPHGIAFDDWWQALSDPDRRVDIVDIFDLFTESLSCKPTEALVHQLMECLQLSLE